MNKTINKFFLTGDKFMPELHLKQPGFTYSGCGISVNEQPAEELHTPVIGKFKRRKSMQDLNINIWQQI